MIWNKKPTILFLSRHGLWLQDTPILEGSWDVEHLQQAFQVVKDEYQPAQVTLILADEFCYIWTEELPAETENVKEALQERVAQHVPELELNLHWESHLAAETDEKKFYQLVAYNTEVIDQLRTALKAVPLNVVQIQASALALAHQVETDQPAWLAYQGHEFIGLALYQGAVVATQQLTAETLEKDIQELLAFVQEKYQVSLSQLTDVQLNPFQAAPAGEYNGRQFLQLKKTQSDQKSDSKKKKSLVSPRLGGLVILLLVLAGALVGLLAYRGWLPGLNQQTAPTPAASPSPTVEPSPTPSPSPTASAAAELDLSQYRLRIENGTGRPGAAAALQDILAAEGFTQFDLANASSYDYQETEVKAYSELPDAVFSAIERSLNSEYSLRIDRDLLTSSEQYDLLIIVGETL